MTRVTSSSSYGTAGLARSVSRVTSASTYLAATRSAAVSAATPASWSPDFSSLALASSVLDVAELVAVAEQGGGYCIGCPLGWWAQS